jgi:lipopolysaccharide export LptBFGC system permease protein LptF
MVIPKRYKKNLKISLFIWAACLVLFALTYVLILRPQGRSKKRLEIKYDEKKQAFEFAQNAARKETQNRLLKQIKDQQNKLGIFITDFEDSANLIFDISRIAREKNVTSLNVENKNEPPTLEKKELNNISESRIVISFNAGFNQFATFLNALERHQPVLFINEFKLMRTNKNKTAYQVEMDVAALIKKQQDNQATAKSPQQLLDEKI